MSVAHDAVSESHTGTTGHSGSASYTWNHIPTGTPRSALVFVFTIGSSGVDTSVTYDGVTMTAIPYTAGVSSGENFFVRGYFLDNIPSGTKAVVVNRTNNATVSYAVCVTQTAAGAAEVYLPGVMTQAGSTSNTAASSSSAATGTAGLKSVGDGSPGTNSQRYMAMGYGGSSVLAAGTGSTSLTTGGAIDFGLYVICTYRETTPGQGARNVGSASGTDDLALIALAVREIPPTLQTATDAGAATDTSVSIVVDIAATEDGVGDDTATVSGNSTPKSATDAGVGSEAAWIGVYASDSGTSSP